MRSLRIRELDRLTRYGRTPLSLRGRSAFWQESTGNGFSVGLINRVSLNEWTRSSRSDHLTRSSFGMRSIFFVSLSELR